MRSPRPSRTQATAAEKAADDLDAYREALDSILANAFSVEEAIDAQTQSIRDFTESIFVNGRTLDENTEAGRTNRAGLRDLVAGAAEVIQAQAEQGATSEELRGSLALQEARLREVAAALGLNAAEADRYIDVLGTVPTDVGTTVTVEGIGAAVTNIGSLRTAIANLRTIVGVTIGGAITGAANQVLPNALGGIVEHRRYAMGGLREDHAAQIAGPGAMRVWAEPETGGEGYVPLANDHRRPRALGVWAEIGRRLGLSVDDALDSGMLRAFAQGGILGQSLDPITIRPPKLAEGFVKGESGGGAKGAYSPAMLWARDQVQQLFGPLTIGGYRASGSVKTSDHPRYRAWDHMVYSDRAKGDAIAAWYLRNASAAQLKYIIWYDRINKGGGWRPYRHPSDPSGRNPTLAHRDHPHTSHLARGGVLGGRSTPIRRFAAGGLVGADMAASGARAGRNAYLGGTLRTTGVGRYAGFVSSVGADDPAAAAEAYDRAMASIVATYNELAFAVNEATAKELAAQHLSAEEFAASANRIIEVTRDRNEHLAKLEQNRNELLFAGLDSAGQLYVLQQGLAQLEQYSDEWMSVRQDIARIEEGIANDAREAAEALTEELERQSEERLRIAEQEAENRSRIAEGLVNDLASAYSSARESFDRQAEAYADAVAQRNQRIEEEVRRFRESIAGPILAAGDLLSSFGGKDLVSGDEVVAMLDHRIEATRRYSSALTALAAGGLNEELLTSLAQAGPSAVNLAEGLVGGDVAGVNARLAELARLGGSVADQFTTRNRSRIEERVTLEQTLPAMRSFDDLLAEELRLQSEANVERAEARDWALSMASEVLPALGFSMAQQAEAIGRVTAAYSAQTAEVRALAAAQASAAAGGSLSPGAGYGSGYDAGAARRGALFGAGAQFRPNAPGNLSVFVNVTDAGELVDVRAATPAGVIRPSAVSFLKQGVRA